MPHDTISAVADKNFLYYGDNLEVLRQHVKDETVDLVYLDPPFNSNRDYNVLFSEQDGSKASAQIKAFEDSWRWDVAAAKAFEETVRGGGRPAEALSAFMVFLGPSDMLAYLSMMAPRLIELRKVLKPTGSIYLHCDPTASHYLKMLMDSVFGPTNFQNEIAWCYEIGGRSKQRWARKHDVLLFYSRGPEFTFNWRAVATERKPGTHMKTAVDDGREYQEKKDRKTGKVYRYYLDEGAIPPDFWLGIQQLNREAKERLRYPTQKPEALLERIILASSKKGDIVLDPFCGCGTAVAAAQHLERRWIGIDITHLAVNLIRHRLRDAYGPEVEKTYQVVGEPTTLDGARELAADDPYQFQWWALGFVGARPTETKKGADRGIDGTLFFLDDAHSKPKRIVFSVKAGKTGAAHLRDLRGVIERDDAAIGVLISMQIPTSAMRKEAASAGFYVWRDLDAGEDRSYPRLQLLTVEELLSGKGVKYPPVGHRTFKQAPKAGPKDRYGGGQHESLFDDSN